MQSRAVNRGQCGRLPPSPCSSDWLTYLNFSTFLFPLFFFFSSYFFFFLFFCSRLKRVFNDHQAWITLRRGQYLAFLDSRVLFRSPYPSIPGWVNYLTRYERSGESAIFNQIFSAEVRRMNVILKWMWFYRM